MATTETWLGGTRRRFIIMAACDLREGDQVYHLNAGRAMFIGECSGIRFLPSGLSVEISIFEPDRHSSYHLTRSINDIFYVRRS